MTPMKSKPCQRNILAIWRRRKPRTKLLPSAEELSSHRRVRMQRFQDGRGEALQRGRELELHERGVIAGREDAILRVRTFVRGTGATCLSGAQHRMRGLRGCDPVTGYPAVNEYVQLKTSKQLTKMRQCLVRMGVPAHDDKRLWKVVDGRQCRIITRDSGSKSVP